jgi:hypothetical protein
MTISKFLLLIHISRIVGSTSRQFFLNSVDWKRRSGPIKLINASIIAQIQRIQIQMTEHLGLQSVQLVAVQINMPQICQA